MLSYDAFLVLFLVSFGWEEDLDVVHASDCGSANGGGDCELRTWPLYLSGV